MMKLIDPDPYAVAETVIAIGKAETVLQALNAGMFVSGDFVNRLVMHAESLYEALSDAEKELLEEYLGFDFGGFIP